MTDAPATARGSLWKPLRAMPLPAPTGAMIGRAEELTRLTGLMASQRLVTVVGVGGVGKSRLALEAAWGFLATHADVAMGFVAAGSDVAALAARVAAVLGIELAGEVDPVTEVARACAGFSVALVLDAFEGLATDTTALHALGRWLDASAGLSLVVTSRHALEAAWEAERGGVRVVLGPLAADGPESAAVQLLEARASADTWRRDSPAMTALATRVEGLPLGLELLAARARWTTPEGLLTWLGPLEAPPDAERLGESVVAPSWEALGGTARGALTALASTCTDTSPELAHRLVQAATPGVGPEVIDELVAASLVAVVEAREGPCLRLLDLVRAFVRKHGDPEHLERATASLDTALIELAPPESTAYEPLSPAKVAAIIAARDEFHACFARGLQPDAGRETKERAVRAASTFFPALLRAHQPIELARLALALLESLDVADPDVPLRPLFFAWLGAQWYYLAKPSAAPMLAQIRERLRRLSALIPDPRESVELDLHEVGAAMFRWDYSRDPSELEALVARAEEVDPALAVRAITFLVLLRVGRGEAERSDVARLEQAARRAEEIGALGLGAAVRTNVGHVLLQLGEPRLALDALAHAQLVSERTGLELMPAYILRERGRALAELGRCAEGARDLEVALERFERGFAERTAVEVALDRAALLLELGRVEAARQALVGLGPRVQSPFERAFHGALTFAAQRLMGPAAPAQEVRLGMIEDHGLALYRALGGAARADDERLAQRCYRGRLARRLFAGVRALEQGLGLGIGLDGHHLAAGGRWVDLSARPVLKTLWRVLCEQRFALRHGAITREHLAEQLWPGERMSAAVRDNRLHASLSGLRKLGPGAAIETVADGVRLAPEVPLVRAAPGDTFGRR